MAHDNQKELYDVGDVVTIVRLEWIVMRVYEKERRYMVTRKNPANGERWMTMYPNHNEITGLSQNALGGA